MFKEVFLLVCILGQSWSELSCEDCHKVQAGLQQFLASNKGLERQVEKSTDAICQSFPLFKANCSDEFPKFWNQIVNFEEVNKNMFSDQKDVCQVACKNKKDAGQLSSELFGNSTSCQEKTALVLWKTGQFFLVRRIIQLVIMMLRQGFCRKYYPQHTRDCALGLEISFSMVTSSITRDPELSSVICQAPTRPTNWFFMTSAAIGATLGKLITAGAVAGAPATVEAVVYALGGKHINPPPLPF